MINRAFPKTQSVLLEVMGEQTVTVDGVSHKVPHPFFVVATQNPVDMEGTYALPEAQLDRFLTSRSRSGGAAWSPAARCWLTGTMPSGSRTVP